MVFTIKKNHHISKIFGFIPHFRLALKLKMEFIASFDKNCLYQIDGIDTWDINKLHGFSTSYSHHVQSARIGWRCRDGKSIEILPYCYDNSKRIFINNIYGTDELLGVVYPNETFKCTISVEPNFFKLTYEKGTEYKEIVVNKRNNSWKLKYLLYPFFGGNVKAPHKMNIKIKNY